MSKRSVREAREAEAVPDLSGELHAARTAIMLAIRHSDPVAEQVARRRLDGWKLADILNRAQARGQALSPAEARDWKLVIMRLVSGIDGAPSSGPDAVARLHEAVAGLDDAGPCDRCDAPGATISASMDLTGNLQPPLAIVRLCATCRAAGEA